MSTKGYLQFLDPLVFLHDSLLVVLDVPKEPVDSLLEVEIVANGIVIEFINLLVFLLAEKVFVLLLESCVFCAWVKKE